jgi:hypothetical protein
MESLSKGHTLKPVYNPVGKPAATRHIHWKGMGFAPMPIFELRMLRAYLMSVNLMSCLSA